MAIVHLAGHLGADPEVRYTSKGQKVIGLRIATNSRKSGKDETTWWRATIWGEQFDQLLPYLKKGSAVMIVGEMHKPEMFTDREGKPQISLNITVCSIQFPPFGKPDRGSNSSHGNENSSQGQGAESHEMAGFSSAPRTFGESKPDDDEVPF